MNPAESSEKIPNLMKNPKWRTKNKKKKNVRLLG